MLDFWRFQIFFLYEPELEAILFYLEGTATI